MFDGLVGKPRMRGGVLFNRERRRDLGAFSSVTNDFGAGAPTCS
jgi:hypothetical protein